MNNKFSDISKVIITTWLIFGAGIGAFVAPLFGTNFIIAGAIGLFAGATVDYVLFFEPWKRKYGLFSYPEEEHDFTEDETESDISEFIKDSFKSEGIVAQDAIEFRNNEDTAPTDENNHESREMENDCDVNSKEVEESDSDSSSKFEHNDDEIDESDEDKADEDNSDDSSEDQDAESDNFDDEAAEEENDEMEERDTASVYYASRNETHSTFNDEYQNEELQGFKMWITPTQLPITLAGIWFFLSGYISSNYPEFTKVITNHFPTSFFTVLPIFFLIGLSGFVGILFREPNETLEPSARENAMLLINLLKIFAGWGVSFYAIFINL